VGVSTRAYSTFEIKSVDEEQRILTGIASTPATDRMEDVVVPTGAKFALPLPFLWQHEGREAAIGHVIAAKPNAKGIPVEIRIASDDVPGILKDRLDYAWRSIKKGLVRGLSIGFKGIDVEPIKGTFGLEFKTWEWMELSAVTIPANQEASITSIKSFDVHTAASGTSENVTVKTAGASASGVRVARKGARTMPKTTKEQIRDFEAERAAKQAQLEAIQGKATDEGRTKDEAEKEEFTTLKAEIKAIDEELVDLRDMESLMVAKAVPANGGSAADASASRGVASQPYITVRENTPPGIGFARMAMAKTVARLDNRYVVDVAKEMFPSDQRLQAYFQKATVTAGTTVSSVYASALVDQTNLTSEFIEYLRPQTIVGKFGTGGIPSLNRVPFNVRITGQTTGGAAQWVGEGAPKPMTAFEFNATTLLYTKIAAIAVITQELARFSTPSAEMLVRNALVASIVERLDTDFIDPAHAAVAAVNPASITNGLTALSSAGTSADNARTDLMNLLESFILANVNPVNVVLIMPNTLALALSLLRNSLGQQEFPGLTMNGGSLEGIPVITSQYAANQSGGGNLVIAVNASDIFLADDGQVSVDMSTEASLQFLDNPTNSSASGTATQMVSLWQTNSIGLRAERFINWAKARTSAVKYMDDVNWGSIGSPS
jgi:HK97 family phage major capsid protein/HK97 family phage prohead protease